MFHQQLEQRAAEAGLSHLSKQLSELRLSLRAPVLHQIN
jgi:hypothetical protein